MEQREAALRHIRNRLAEMQVAVKLDQAIKNYALNGVAENYFRDVLNFIAAHCSESSFLHGCDFENLNFTEPNAAHIDLVDKNKKLAFQITSTKTAEKIRNTLQALNKPAYSGCKIKIFYLLGKPEAAEGTLAEGKLNKQMVSKLNEEFSLNVLDCLFDSTDLRREIDDLEGEKLIELKEKYFTKPPEKVIHVYHQSQDFHVLSAQVKELQEQCRLHPEIPYFYDELKKAKENLATFERDVLALTEYFAKTPVNTERLRLAKDAFEAGNYQTAREILNTEEMAQEQTSLLKRQQQLQTQQAEIAEQLASNATEFVLKAQLTAIDYSLPDRIEQTKALFETALKSARNPDHLLRYAKFLQEHSQFAASQPLYLEALADFREIGDQAGEGATLNNLGLTAHRKGDYATALEYLQQSLAITREIGDQAGEGTVLNNLSQIYKARGDYATALNYLQQSLVLRREIGDKTGEGTTLNNLSQIYKARGDYATALDYLQQSLVIQREIGNKAGEGATLSNLGLIAQAKGDYATALDYSQQSLAIQREIGDKAGEGVTLNNLGLIAQAKGDYATALDYYQQSLAIQREIGNKAGEGATLSNLGLIAQAKGDYATPLDYYQQSLAILREIGDKAGMSISLFNIGHIYQQNGNTERAMQHWRESYQIAKKIGEAQALSELEKLAGQIGLPNGLAVWETLAQRMEET